MTTTLSAEMALDLLALLADLGTSGTISRGTPGTYDPSSPTDPTITTTSFGVTVALTKFSDEEVAGSGGEILRTDRRAIIGATTSGTIKNNDNLTTQGQTLQVVIASEISPAGIVMGYIAQVRNV